MRLSIVVPVWNGAQYLDQFRVWLAKLEGIGGIEVVAIVKDSSDMSFEILDRMSTESHIMSVIRQGRECSGGIPGALNKGFSIAKGEYLCWLNIDDGLDLNFLEKFVGLIRNSSDVYVAKSEICDEIHQRRYIISPYTPRARNYCIRNSGNWFTGSVFFKKKVFECFGGFDTKYKFGFEYELFLFLLKNKKIQILNLVAGKFVLHGANLSVKHRSELEKDFSEIILNKNCLWFDWDRRLLTKLEKLFYG